MGVKSTVGVEISTKLWETVFEEISKVVAGPRDPADALAELPELDAGKDADDEIVGEFDDDGVEDDLPRIQEQRESESADVIDGEIVDAGYTDAPMTIGSGTATPDTSDSPLRGPLSPDPVYPGPLGPTGQRIAGCSRCKTPWQPRPTW